MPEPIEINLGPFTLQRIIGSGAMGDVWSGVHRGQQIPVAVKVMSHYGTWQEEHIERFRKEVKAVARLTHPGIIMVLDYGEIPVEIGELSRGLLGAGTPYLAMELAPYGALDNVALPLPWLSLKAVLLNVLDALAHAHARGVVHRDIKPANVLITARDRWEDSLKLTDFGIAQAADDQGRGGNTEMSVGTPNYMAPEQFEGYWRDFGPWTDLYAVGCMAFELASGALPFDADSFVAQAYKHLKVEPPKLVTETPYPPGFENWLRRLLAKEPRRRFQRAADAAFALMALDGLEGLDLGATEPSTFALGWTDNGPRTVTDGALPQWSTGDWEPQPARAAETQIEDLPGTQVEQPVKKKPRGIVPVTLRREDTPPLPPTWRRTVAPPRSMKMVGAGLGLYGLRTIPMVGREAQRDAVWSALQKTVDTGRVHLLLLRGAAGVGKSRLVRWVCERAHEVGVATLFSAFYSPIPGPGDGLPRMIARHMDCVGLDRPAALDRIERVLRKEGVEDDYEWHGLTQVIHPFDPVRHGGSKRTIEFESPSEWYTLIRRTVSRASQTRASIVWLDDIQWGADALGFAEHLLTLKTRAPQPILLLLTAREEALAQRTVESAMLTRLLAHENAAELDLPALSDEESAALVQELLGLEGDLAQQVEQRCGGNPLFAVQLVGDWVQRGVLEVGERGFVLKPGERAVLPDDIHQIVAGRMDVQLAGHTEAARRSMELAACLGQEFDGDEWRGVCAMAGVEAPFSLLDSMMMANLIHPTERGWVFTHGMLRESLERTANEQGRGAENNILCADALLERYGDGARGVAERVGLHYLTAGDLSLAMPHLQRAAEEHATAGEYDQALEVLARLAEGLSQMGLPDSDARWGDGDLTQARIFKRQGRLDESKTLSMRLETRATKHKWDTLLPRALQNTADVMLIQGEMRQAATIYRQALALYEAAENDRGQAHVLFGLADVRCQTGDLDGAHEFFERVRGIFDTLGINTEVAESLCGMGRVAAQRGDLIEAVALFRRALGIFKHHGGRSHIADCLKSLADVARYQGQHNGAQQGYEQALAFYESAGSGDAVHTRQALALLHLQRDEHAEARDILTECLAVFAGTGERDDVARVHIQLLPCLAAANDWTAFERHSDKGWALIRETGRFDRDIADPARRAGDLALAAGKPDMARRAYVTAHYQWSISQQQGRAAEIENLLHNLGHPHDP